MSVACLRDSERPAMRSPVPVRQSTARPVPLAWLNQTCRLVEDETVLLTADDLQVGGAGHRCPKMEEFAANGIVCSIRAAGPTLGSPGDELEALREEGKRLGKQPPSYGTLEAARTFLMSLVDTVRTCEMPFRTPHLSGTHDGTVALEWWSDPRKLTVYVSEAGAEYVRSWGASIDREMDDGAIRDDTETAGLWRWLDQGA